MLLVNSAKENHNMYQKKVQLEEGREVELNFGDEVGFALTGVVTMGEKSIEAASVTAHQSDGLCFKCVRTNSKGEFRITGIPEGDYQIFTNYSSGLDPKTFRWGPGENYMKSQKISINRNHVINIDLTENKAVQDDGKSAVRTR